MNWSINVGYCSSGSGRVAGKRRGLAVSVNGSLAGRKSDPGGGRAMLPSTAEKSWLRPGGVREMPSRHFIEHLVCMRCCRGFWIAISLCPRSAEVLPGVADGVRGFLGQTFRRAPGVLDSRERVRRSRPDPGGSQIGYGSRLGLGLRWTGLDLVVGLRICFLFIFLFNQIKSF